MLRTTLAFLFLWTIPVAAVAQACGTEDLIADLTPIERAQLDELVAAHPYPNGNLFRASKPGSTVTVVGTLHLPDPRHAKAVDAVRPALEDADLLILEASSETQLDLQQMASIKPDLFFITEGPTLIDLLSEEEWAELTEILSEYQIPGFMAAKFKPWFLGMTLAVPACAMESLRSGEKGLDYMIEAIALKKGIPLAELDELDSLLDILAGDPMEEQLDGLRMWLDMQEEGEAGFTTMIEAYFDGRIREAWEFSRILLDRKGLADAEAQFNDLNQSVLIDRNVAWEPKIVELVEGKNAVIAVGAAHLSGETGVLRALERAGYKVSPL